MNGLILREQEEFTRLSQSIPNEEFRHTLTNLQLKERDYILTGPVQVGKTKLILLLTWLAAYVHNMVPIVVAWDKLTLLDQLLQRTDQFNQTTKYPLKPTIITPTSYTNPANLIYYTILQAERMKQALQLIQEINKPILLILDEADQAIKSEDSVLDQILQQILGLDQVSVVYISATNFVLYNCLHRTHRLNKPIQTISLPSDLYTGLVYRSYKDFIHVQANILDRLKDLTEMTDPHWRDFLSVISVLTKEKIETKPNIGLLNVTQTNAPKHELAQIISKEFTDLQVLVYTGEGTELYLDGLSHGVSMPGICIENVLQTMKDNKLYSTEPILIIATGMANRAQTFKSRDNQWILTHLFLSVADHPSIDTLVQAQRCNGQYKPEQSIATIYASKRNHCWLQVANDNNLTLNQVIGHSEDFRQAIIKPAYAKVGRKLLPWSNRKGVDDTYSHRLALTQGDAMFNSVELCQFYAIKAAMTNQIKECVWVTEMNILSVDKYVQLCTDQPIASRKGLTPLQVFTDNEERYKGLSPKFQRLFRQWLLEQVKLTNSTCQLSYSKARQEQLNQLHHLKNPQQNFRARVIALEATNNRVIPAVVYKEEYFNNPNAYEGKIIMWHRTDGQCCYYINDLTKRSAAISYGYYSRRS